ncbi:hypothetical protein Dsin_018755 [Dipteronia sinensis]|uniref:RNase H type-1 domain-containing protein n=1 Tax=Dipteronia sinensis TaxID=43782 RepID=A0AAE0A6R3_9ROSI|nr:hypothetical protein Dsin_018755 [Dipteronia sinensis]
MVSDATRLKIGCIRNSVKDLLILRSFGICGHPARAPVIKSVFWSPSTLGWVTSFVKGCFATPLGQIFAFEAELLAASMAINFAWNCGWHQIWLESDSSYVVHLFSSHSDSVLWHIWQA